MMEWWLVIVIVAATIFAAAMAYRIYKHENMER